ncbi:MAG: helix-turn-helix transcriptional regulator [Clostridia bacterium]|jgi:transcriptional regulator with XRE-family HTH domain|nr:helix-turn-helix transcriptional regulator [Clostridia bacterium]
MKLKDSIAKRVQELCDKNSLTVHGLSLKTGVANSTLCDIVKANNESVQIKFIYGICAGLNMSLEEFFSSPYFDMKELTD